MPPIQGIVYRSGVNGEVTQLNDPRWLLHTSAWQLDWFVKCSWCKINLFTNIWVVEYFCSANVVSDKIHKLQKQIKNNFDLIVYEIEPKLNIVHAMLGKRVIDKATSEDVTRRITRSERAKTLVDVVLQSRHPNCCSVFLEALREDHEWVYGQVTPCKAKMI